MNTELTNKLFEAIENLEYDVAQEIIKNGTDLSTRKDGLTAFQAAAYKWDSYFVKQLLPLGADIHEKTDAGKTLLHIAAELDSTYLLEDIEGIETIDIEIKDNSGKTAFNVAASCGSILLTHYLHEKGANINTSDHEGKTPLMNALEYIDKKKIKSWESEGTIDGVSVRYEIINGWMRCIEPYYGNKSELGETVDEVDQVEFAYEDWTPDEMEIYQDAVSHIRITLMKLEGMDFLLKDGKGNTAVHYACKVGETWILNDMTGKMWPYFDTKNFNFNEPNADGVYPLHLLAKSKRWDALDFYFEHFSEVNVIDNNGWSAGHYLANQGGHHEMAKLLVEKGLNLSLESTQAVGKFPAGTKAFEIAKQHLDHDMADILFAGDKIEK
jgi:ankyrin repeat protein